MAGFSKNAFDELRAFCREQAKRARAIAAGSRAGKTFLSGKTSLGQTLRRWAQSPAGKAIARASAAVGAAVEKAWNWLGRSPIGQAIAAATKSAREANRQGEKIFGKKIMGYARTGIGYALLLVVAPLGFMVPFPAPIGMIPAIVGMTLILHESPWAQRQAARLRDHYPQMADRLIGGCRKFLPNLTAEFETLTNPDKVLGPKDPATGKRRPPGAAPPPVPPQAPPVMPPPIAPFMARQVFRPTNVARPAPRGPAPPVRHAPARRAKGARFTP